MTKIQQQRSKVETSRNAIKTCAERLWHAVAAGQAPAVENYLGQIEQAVATIRSNVAQVLSENKARREDADADA